MKRKEYEAQVQDVIDVTDDKDTLLKGDQGLFSAWCKEHGLTAWEGWMVTLFFIEAEYHGEVL